MNTQMAKARNIHQSQTELIFVTEVGSLSTRRKWPQKYSYGLFSSIWNFLCHHVNEQHFDNQKSEGMIQVGQTNS